MSSDRSAQKGAILTIDLAAIRANYRLLKERLGRAACGAVVKADAYGLGAERVVPALAAEGCLHFFVAHLDEALVLRPHLPGNATLYVLHGPPAGADEELVAHRLVPVLNSFAQLEAWTALARRREEALPAVLQLDTGMSRLGLSTAELATLAREPRRLAGIELRYVMSHLACADERGHPLNARQLACFRATLPQLPFAKASLANSSGIFLGPDYHFDLARPGAALYGLAPVEGETNPMRQVVRLEGKVIQLRDVPAGASVGYGASWQAASPRRIATVAVGYADGFPRSLSNATAARYRGTLLPLIGRVSMDTITLDASALAPDALQPGSLVELIGEGHGIDAVAAEAGTIGYEILTRLGQRYFRRYLGEEP